MTLWRTCKAVAYLRDTKSYFLYQYLIDLTVYHLRNCLYMYTGTLRINITGPRGDLIDFDLLPFNTDADNNSDMFVMKFLPRCQGM